MKSKMLIVIFVLMVVNICRAQGENFIPLGQVISLLGRAKIINVVGWEVLPVGKSDIANSNLLQRALANGDLPFVIHAIETETDYRCLEGRNYLIVCPKINKSSYDEPIIMRDVSVPFMKQGSFNQFLHNMKSTSDPRYGAYLTNSGQDVGQIDGGKVTFDAGHGPCFKFLNRIAEQIGAHKWVISHMVMPDDKTKLPRKPMKLNVGLIDFYR